MSVHVVESLVEDELCQFIQTLKIWCVCGKPYLDSALAVGAANAIAALEKTTVKIIEAEMQCVSHRTVTSVHGKSPSDFSEMFPRISG